MSTDTIPPDGPPPRAAAITIADLQRGAEALKAHQAKAAANKPIAVTQQRPRVSGHFVIASLNELKAAAAALESPALLMWLFLVYTARIQQTMTVEVTNAALTSWGINRDAKYRALKRLQAADLITIERRGRHNPQVTLLTL